MQPKKRTKQNRQTSNPNQQTKTKKKNKTPNNNKTTTTNKKNNTKMETRTQTKDKPMKPISYEHTQHPGHLQSKKLPGIKLRTRVSRYFSVKLGWLGISRWNVPELSGALPVAGFVASGGVER